MSGVRCGRLQLLAAVGAAALALGAAGCAADEPDTTVVPGVRSSNVSHAFSAIREAGLRVAIDDALVVGSLVTADVRAQEPIGGTVMVEGSVVSLGPIEPGALGSPDFPAGEMPSAIVPDFVGRPVADAAAWAEDDELFWEASFPPLQASDAATLLDAYVGVAQQPAPGERLARDGAS